MDNETEYTLMHRSADNAGSTGVPAPVETVRDDAAALAAEQESIANVDTCIQQASEALRTGRESVARSFFAQKPEAGARGSDPRLLLKMGRQRVIDQMNVEPPARGTEIAERSAAALGDLNRQLGEQVARLAADLTEGRTRAEVFKIQLRATLDTYRTSVERLFASRITINVR